MKGIQNSIHKLESQLLSDENKRPPALRGTKTLNMADEIYKIETENLIGSLKTLKQKCKLVFSSATSMLHMTNSQLKLLQSQSQTFVKLETVLKIPFKVFLQKFCKPYKVMMKS